jgi:cytochrome c oxidase assembly factor CtaG
MSAPPPVVSAELVAVAAVYLWASRRPARWDPVRSVCFLAGLAAIAIALGPLDAAADAGLPGHMTQHLVLILVAPPLLLGGAPIRLALATSPPDVGRAVVRIARSRPVELATRPAIALSLFAAIVFGAHVPGFYDAAVGDSFLHASEHVLFLLAGLLLWLPVLTPSPIPGRLSPLGRVLYLLLAMFPGAAIGLVLMTSTGAVYPIYGSGPAALDDQWRAGMIMWATGAAVLGAAIVAVGWRALLAEERRQRIRDSHDAGAPTDGALR